MSGDDDTSGKTFTQADIDKAFAAGRQQARQAAETKYADYDDLKARAAEADKNKSEIEKLTSSVQALTDRAVKAERDSARAAVAEELGLTAKEARRLTGTTREELLADGRDFVADMGIDIEARKKGKTTAPAGKGGDGQEGDDDREDDEPQQQAPARRRERPREDLRSGAPTTRREPESTNPMDLIKNIPR